MLSFTTAGESHGQALIAILENIPAGLPLLASDVDTELVRRQQGYGRGRRMKIESDHIEFLSGVRAGETIGSPIAMLIPNRDWVRWSEIMDPAPRPEDLEAPRKRAVTRVRPGHADFTGIVKYNRTDARDILERASARETTARVAAGAICKVLLAQCNITIGSHVINLGGIDTATPTPLPDDINAVADLSPLRTLDPLADQRMIELIDATQKARDTLGGICEIVITNLPIGLGSHVSWERRLDGRLAQAMMSIPAVKGVDIGLGFETAKRPGSRVHDEILPAPGRTRAGHVKRDTNNAGGTEGGMTTGEPLVLHVAMKPISPLMKPLNTVDFSTGETAAAVAERSDVTAVPAMGVIAEAMAAFVLADVLVEKFGSDSLAELKRNLNAYLEQIDERLG